MGYTFFTASQYDYGFLVLFGYAIVIWVAWLFWLIISQLDILISLRTNISCRGRFLAGTRYNPIGISGM